MEQTGAISRNQNRKRKRKQKGADANLCAMKKNPTDNASPAIDKLSDDLLINILSRLSLKEAARTSVLERRWRSLWNFMNGTLQFVYRHPMPTGDDVEIIDFGPWKKFVAWASSVLELHQGGFIEGLVISFIGIYCRYKANAVDNWVYSAVQKEVERFELNFNRGYNFPSLEMLISHSRSGSPFRCLRMLRLVDITVKDEVVNYFLVSCPNLEQLCMVRCRGTKNVLVVDPPSLRVLEMKRCYNLQSLEVSAASLVSLGYGGSKNVKSTVLLKETPNIRELTVVDDLFVSFFSEPEKHSSYRDQLVKLVVDTEFSAHIKPLVAPLDLPQLCCLKLLEVITNNKVGRSLLFFTAVIKASPQLCEFRIEVAYKPFSFNVEPRRIPFPAKRGAKDPNFKHKRLKVVEMVGYIGCSSDAELLRALLKKAPLIERVVIDTQSAYYDDYKCRHPRDRIRIEETTRSKSQNHAQHLVSTFPQQIQFIVT